MYLFGITGDLDSLGIFISENGRATDGIPRVIADASDDIKTQIRRTLSGIMNVDSFTLEQVYALGDKKYMGPDGNVDIIHLGIINGTHIHKINPEYELINISIQHNEIPNKTTRRGHRPGKIYTFIPKTGDSWL